MTTRDEPDDLAGMIRPLRVTTRILDLIGGTPMVRLRHLPGADAGEVWCKCEHWNPGG